MSFPLNLVEAEVVVIEDIFGATNVSIDIECTELFPLSLIQLALAPSILYP
jgi:hypothetical protein